MNNVLNAAFKFLFISFISTLYFIIFCTKQPIKSRKDSKIYIKTWTYTNKYDIIC